MVEQVNFTNCLDRETKYYNLKILGLITGGVSGIIAASTNGMITGSFVSLGGYLTGAYISNLWYYGILQRALYWNLPTPVLKYLPMLRKSRKYLPPSHTRKFM